ncbi:PLP-dependent transferase [Alloscardovia macacae]|uniref:PLP-dependent transferase n=1 Tax=Alloscardovia macacae TaxID=1160091 RepID=UPI001313FCB8|nr:PLP-dependent transferase [Alloscardovia macacae]
MTPLNQQSIDLGAGIVVHSDIMVGVVVTNAPNLDEKLYFALNRVGGVLTPQDANLLRSGLQTLDLRLEHQEENALTVACWLDVSRS